MAIGAFTDKTHQPAPTEIVKALGSLRQPWQALVQHIRATYPVQEDLHFCYGKQYGWAFRFRSKGSLLTALYPARNSFVVQIILSRPALEQAQTLPLGEAARQAIARAKPYPEGKWLFIPVQSEHDLRDVQCLLALKLAASSRKKARPAASNSG